MYTLCRAKSLVAKSEQNVSLETIDDELGCDNIQIDHLKLLLQLPLVLQKASISHEPSTVVDYMFKVAQSYNSIYNTHKKMSQDTVGQLISM
jgi:arginyl-tRNA synthetase